MFFTGLPLESEQIRGGAVDPNTLWSQAKAARVDSPLFAATGNDL
jgi:hypothetical protein